MGQFWAYKGNSSKHGLRIKFSLSSRTKAYVKQEGECKVDLQKVQVLQQLSRQFLIQKTF